MIKITTAIFLALFLTACSPSETEKISTPIKIQETISSTDISDKVVTPKEESTKPLLSIYTLDSKEIKVYETTGGLTFEGYENREVFVVLFGYRCPPCLQEMPNLIAIMEKKYPDLTILAIEVQGLDSDALEEFKARKGINYTLAIGSDNNKFINYIASKAQWQGSIPFFLAFNKKGEVKVVHVGALSSKQLEAVYTDLQK